MAGEYILALDLGGLRIKGLIYGGGKIISTRTIEVKYIGDGLIDGRWYIENCRRLVQELVNAVDAERCLVAITSQRASMVGWDEELSIITPIYTWKHRSGYDVLMEVKSRHELGPLEMFLQPGAGILRAKYILDNYRVDYVAGVEAAVIYSLFGESLTSYSLAYPYGCLEPFSLSWVDEILSILGIDEKFLPKLREERISVSGEVSSNNLVLSSLVADQSASLIGSACLAEGYGKASLGTGCFIDVFTRDNFIGDPMSGINPMLVMVSDGTPYFMAEYFIYHWGDILDWLVGGGVSLSEVKAGSLSQIPKAVPSPDYLTTEFRRLVRHGIKLLDIPIGIDLHKIYHAMIYSLIYLLRRGVESINNLTSIHRFTLDGGWSMDNNLTGLIASFLGRELHLRRNRDKSALIGALSLSLCEGIDDLGEIVESLNPIETVSRPISIEGLDSYIHDMDMLFDEFTEASS